MWVVVCPKRLVDSRFLACLLIETGFEKRGGKQDVVVGISQYVFWILTGLPASYCLIHFHEELQAYPWCQDLSTGDEVFHPDEGEVELNATVEEV